MVKGQTYSSNYYALIATNSVTIDLTTHTSGPTNIGSSTTVLGHPCRAIVPQGAAGGTCTLAVTRMDGNQVSITYCAYGVELPIHAKKILPGSNYTAALILW